MDKVRELSLKERERERDGWLVGWLVDWLVYFMLEKNGAVFC